jgi:predicted negative regulator of RcsB-dependent stress response
MLIIGRLIQYWGWVKYRYRQEDKSNFAQAKAAAIKWLDACPIDIIQHFINQSYRFMDAYRQGLTGEAAAWAVRQQKCHCTVSESAMKAFESSLQNKNKKAEQYTSLVVPKQQKSRT